MQLANNQRVDVLAHRGTSLLAPENTLPAFEFARQHRADTLELDVRLTRDRTLVVIHDATLARTTDGNGRIADYKLIALKGLDAAYRFDADGGFPCRGTGVQLSTISEVIAEFSGMAVNIDIKDNATVAVDVLAREVRTAGAEHRVVVASFHPAVLHYCRVKYPWLKTSACSADVKRFLWCWFKRDKRASELPVSLFQLPRRYFFLSFESHWFVDAVHEAGGKIHFWTVNDAKVMRKLITKGADGIVTDRADIAANVIAELKDRHVE